MVICADSVGVGTDEQKLKGEEISKSWRLLGCSRIDDAGVDAFNFAAGSINGDDHED